MNMKKNKYWFKSKRFGWGYVPISWEGWLSVAIFMVLIYLSGYLNNVYQEPINNKDLLSFLFDTFIIILVTLPFYQKKSKDKARWRWGK